MFQQMFHSVFSSRQASCRILFLLPAILCSLLMLNACTAARSDTNSSGSLPTARVSSGQRAYLDVSSDGEQADDIRYVLGNYLASELKMETVSERDGADVVIRVVAGRPESCASSASSMSGGQALAGAAVGAGLGALFGSFTGRAAGTAIGAGAGALLGVGTAAMGGAARETWRLNAEVGIRTDGRSPAAEDMHPLSVEATDEDRDTANVTLIDTLCRRIVGSMRK
ncbi:MAG: hypothetical protein K6F46_00645 [Desulfovibrio sp.]|nr:hypothetical protein [Desulfovibrio sp.]